MKCLNEPIARKANAEDQCTGHFWEARFYSQPLCSERALLTAMAYVDLNPIRAKLTKTPERSEYTSIKARLEGDYRRSTLRQAVARMLGRGELHHFDTPIRLLMPFADGAAQSIGNPTTTTLPMRQHDYFKLVDATGRMIGHDNALRMFGGGVEATENIP